MRILVTNDDGINAPGLQVLEDIARDLAGPAGEVWTVAPAFEQSGVGHKISYTHPMMVAQLGPRRFAAEGAPADCVLAGIYDVMDGPPDLVLSGVNRGNNAAENTLYSGTIGAAIEAALQGVRAIALSQYYGPDNRELDNQYEAATVWGERVIKSLLDKAPWDGEEYSLFYNINFPPCPASAVKGVAVTRQGRRPGVKFSTEPQISPSGRRFVWIKGGAQQVPTPPDTDNQANLDGYVSVTPMRCDLTAHETLEELRATLG